MREYTVKEYELQDYDDFRDNLTNEHTIALLRRIKRGYIGDWNYTGEEHDFDLYTLHCALWKAIEVLEKEQTNDKL